MQIKRLLVSSWDLTPSSGFCEHYLHVVHIHPCRQSTYIQKNKNIFKITAIYNTYQYQMWDKVVREECTSVVCWDLMPCAKCLCVHNPGCQWSCTMQAPWVLQKHLRLIMFNFDRSIFRWPDLLLDPLGVLTHSLRSWVDTNL